MLSAPARNHRGIANDSTASLLFRNNRNGTFELGALAGTAYNEDGRGQAGMGVAAGDYNGDGWLDIIKTNFADDTSTCIRINAMALLTMSLILQAWESTHVIWVGVLTSLISTSNLPVAFETTLQN